MLNNVVSKPKPKAASHVGECIPAGYCHAHMLLYVSGVNYNVHSNYISISHNSAAEFLRFGKFPPQICESCGATYRYINRLVTCKAHLVL